MIDIAVEPGKALTISPGNKLIKRKGKHVDIGLLATIFVLLALGLMMVLSASAPSALTYNGDSYFFFKSQAKNALLGIAIMFMLSFVDYRIYKGRIADLMMVRKFSTIAFNFYSGNRCH